MENDMIERVARALAGYFGPEFDKLLPSRAEVRKWGMPGDNDQDSIREAARAAIEAMRDPTEAQYEALSATDKMWRELDSKTVWQTYIDAALQPRAPITVG